MFRDRDEVRGVIHVALSEPAGRGEADDAVSDDGFAIHEGDDVIYLVDVGAANEDEVARHDGGLHATGSDTEGAPAEEVGVFVAAETVVEDEGYIDDEDDDDEQAKKGLGGEDEGAFHGLDSRKILHYVVSGDNDIKRLATKAVVVECSNE